jgi:transposase
VVCPTPAPQIVFQEDVRAVTEPTARLQRLAQELQDQVPRWRLAPVVDALQGLRGVPFTVAVTMVAELGDLTRVATPRQLRSSRGLTPSEYSSGEPRRQGGLTKTGNTHARRALIEGTWAYRSPAKVSRHLQRRLEKLPKPMQDISWKAQGRLCKRFRRLTARGNHANQVVVAIARELVGCMWAIAQQVPVTRSGQQSDRSEGNTGRIRTSLALKRCRSGTGQGGGSSRCRSLQLCCRAARGMLPPVVRPCGHRPPRGLHEPAG